ncbi:fibroblast growth factor receptor 2 [Plakobranchus ocellatus]|uniref:Fibroblast growth factor receptor 2 n=1 Tax=Plakobranchus ocellatus TaxID=259542 RepID=A0AAV4ABS9_9GAST|nr:fibroblast growth factor receptor 2 [Plakobranchus ocellatus]
MLPIVSVALVVITLLMVKLYRVKKNGRLQNIYSMDTADYRPYHLFAPGSGHSQNLLASTHVVADHWEIPLSSLKFGPILGQGAFGKVALGRVSRAMLTHRGLAPFMADGGKERLKDGDTLHATVAIKMLQEGCDRKLHEDFLKEIRLMKRIGYHRNVISMLACCTLREPLCLLVEHITRGDLHNFMHQCRAAQSRVRRDISPMR